MPGVGVGIGTGIGFGGVESWQQYWTKRFAEIYTSAIAEIDSEFTTTVGDHWQTNSGSPTWDIAATTPGALTISFRNGFTDSICLSATGLNPQAALYYFETRVKKVSGTDLAIQIGQQATSEGNYNCWLRDITTSYKVFTGYFNCSAGGTVGICSYLSAGAATYEFDYLRIYKVTVGASYKNNPKSFNLSNFMAGVNKTKALNKVLFIGDSVTAYSVTASAGDAAYESPPRTLYKNTWVRQVYNYMKTRGNFHAPTFRQAAHADWTKSGTWVASDGTPFLTNADGDNYRYSVTATNYMEITVPAGKENFALIVAQDDNEFSNDFDDAVAVTLNGGSIAAYGSATLNTYRTKINAGDKGEPYHIYLYSGLPAGANTIRITKSNNTKTLCIWGGAYWTGSAIIAINNGYSGTSTISNFVKAKKTQLDNQYDFIFFEITMFNDYDEVGTNYKDWLNALRKWNEYLKDTSQILYWSHYPCGINPGTYPAGTNEYTVRQPPTMADFLERTRIDLIKMNVSYLNIWEEFKRLIEAAGHTVSDGWAGYAYTVDTLHPNATSSQIIADYINANAISTKLD